MGASASELDRTLQECSARARRVASTLRAEDFVRRPGPGRWSVAECLQHLNLTTEAFLPRFRDALAKASAEKPPGFAPDIAGWLIETVVSTAWVKTKTTAPFVPATARPASEVLADWERLQGELIGCLQQAQGPLAAMRVESPFAAGVKYRVDTAFRIIAAHQKRHLTQAEAAARKVAG